MIENIAPTPARASSPLQLNWAGWLFVAAVATVIISVVLQILTPKQTSVALPQTVASRQNMDGSASVFSNVVYSGSEIEIPAELPIVTADLSEQAATEIVEYLVKFYGLKQNEELPSIWMSEAFLLSKNTNNHEYLLTNLTGQFESTYLSLAVAQEVVGQILADYPSLAALSLLENQTKYFEMNQAHSEEVLPAKANAISLEYSWKIENLPIYLPKRSEGGFVAIISADRAPIRLSFPLSVPVIGAQASINKTISLKEAITQLNQSNGSVIYAEQTDAKPFDVSMVSSAQLKTVSLEYRIDPELKLAIPYYRFGGVIKNNAGSIYNAQLLTPAVATTPIQ